MPLSDEDKARAAREEKSFLAQKRAEQARILKEMEADRKYNWKMNSSNASASAAAPVRKPKLTIRLRYELDKGAGNTRVEIEGTPAELTLFHLLQAIEDNCQVPVSQQILRPADDTCRPPKPKDEIFPTFSAFASIDEMPTLQALNVVNGQTIYLSQAPPGEDVTLPAVVTAPAQVVADESPAEEPDSDPSPVASPAPATGPAPALAPAQTRIEPAAKKLAAAYPEPAPLITPAVGSGTAAVRYSEENRMKYVWRQMESEKLKLHKDREERERGEVRKVREDPETARLAGLLLWSPQEIEFYSKLKAELDRTVGLELIKEFIVQRLRDAAGRHILKEGKQPHRHVLISGHFGVGKRFAAELIGRLFALLSSTTTGGRVRIGARVHLAAQDDPENRGALLTRSDVGVVTEEMHGSHKPIRVQGPSGRFGNYREEELVADRDFLTSLRSLSELQDPKTMKVRVAEGTCYLLRLEAGGSLTEADGAILEAVLDVGLPLGTLRAWGHWAHWSSLSQGPDSVSR